MLRLPHRRQLVAFLLAWGLMLPALAAPRVVIEAWVDPDLRTIRGTLHAEALGGARWIDPLRGLPVPDHELDRVRTYPGKVSHGRVRWTQGDDGILHFETELPRRRGDVGSAPRGLFANGAWYPQPLVDGRPPLVDWEIDVSLPPDTAGALGDTAGRARLRWRGAAERASLAVLPHGHITELRGRTWSLTLLTRFAPRRQLTNGLTQLLDLAAMDGVVDRGVAVEAPLPRRLFRPGAGLVYVGDRAWRVTPVFRWLHHPAGARAVLTAWHPHPDPLVRGLTGSLRADTVSERGERQRTRRTPRILHRLRPVADAMLFSREMPYQSEVFHQVVPRDPIDDDLMERLQPIPPAPLLAAQLRDGFGDAAVEGLRRRLARGQSLDEALTAVGIPPDDLQRRLRPYRPQDYLLEVGPEHATVTRVAPADQPPETVVLEFREGRGPRSPRHREVLAMSEGSDEHVVDIPKGHGRVRLDPDRHVGQLSPIDIHPAPMRALLAGSIAGINISERFVEAFGAVSLRRANDTRNLAFVRLDTNQRAHLAAQLAYTRFLGPPTRLTRRLHAFTIGVRGAWLADRFEDNQGADLAAGGSLGYTFDNRRSNLFPREGARFSVGLNAGGMPQDGRTWLRGTTTLVGMFPAHPRVVLASRLRAGVAATDIAQERLAFGGAEGVRGVADREVQTNVQGIGSFEIRFVPVQRIGLPLAALTWLEELQITLGFDAGVGLAVDSLVDLDANSGDPLVAAIGATVGLGAIVHHFGVAPAAVTLTAGLPAYRLGFTPPPDRRGLPVEIYITWGVQF